MRAALPWSALALAILVGGVLTRPGEEVHFTYPPPPAPEYVLCQTPSPDGSTLGQRSDGSWWYFADKDPAGTYPACPDAAYLNPVPSAPAP